MDAQQSENIAKFYVVLITQILSVGDEKPQMITSEIIKNSSETLNYQANANIQYIDKYLKAFEKKEKLQEWQVRKLIMIQSVLIAFYDKYHHTKKNAELSLETETLETMRENLKTINALLGKVHEARFDEYPDTLEADENNSKKNTKFRHR